MQIRNSVIKLVFTLFIIANPFAVAQTFMSQDEMLETFSGVTLSGISNTGYSGTRWTQVYEEFKEGQTEGTIKGNQAGNSYDSKWFIKNGKWCENWGSGSGCYDLVLVDEKTVRAYKNGTALENLWEIQ